MLVKSESFQKLSKADILFLILCTFYLALNSVISPPTFGYDDWFFTEPAVNFALGKGLVTVFSANNPTLEYRFYTDYPPVYPLLMGIWFKIFGIGDYQQVIFNALILLLKAYILIIYAKRVLNIDKNYVYATLGVISLLVAAIHYRGRVVSPENLAICISLLSFLLMKQGRNFSAFLASGISLLTHPVAGIVSLLCLITMSKNLHLHDFIFRRQKCNLLKAMSPFFVFFLPSVVLLAYGMMFEQDALYEYYKRFKSVNTFGYVVDESFNLKEILLCTILPFKYFQLYFGVFIFSHVSIVMLSIVFLILVYFRYKQTGFIIAAFVSFFIFLFARIVFAPKLFVLSMCSTIVCFYAICMIGSYSRGYAKSLLVAFAAFTALFNLHTFLQDIYQRFFFRDIYHANKMELRSYVEKMPEEEFLIIDANFYFLIKPYHPKVCQQLGTSQMYPEDRKEYESNIVKLKYIIDNFASGSYYQYGTQYFKFAEKVKVLYGKKFVMTDFKSSELTLNKIDSLLIRAEGSRDFALYYEKSD